MAAGKQVVIIMSTKSFHCSSLDRNGWGKPKELCIYLMKEIGGGGGAASSCRPAAG